MNDKPKKIRTWQHLLLIPAALLFDVIILIIAVLADSYLIPWDQNAVGHPFPVVTLIAAMVAICVLGTVTLAAVILFVMGCVKKGKEKKEC